LLADLWVSLSGLSLGIVNCFGFAIFLQAANVFLRSTDLFGIVPHRVSAVDAQPVDRYVQVIIRHANKWWFFFMNN
jgi:hypothetical protein